MQTVIPKFSAVMSLWAVLILMVFSLEGYSQPSKLYTDFNRAASRGTEAADAGSSAFRKGSTYQADEASSVGTTTQRGHTNITTTNPGLVFTSPARVMPTEAASLATRQARRNHREKVVQGVSDASSEPLEVEQQATQKAVRQNRKDVTSQKNASGTDVSFGKNIANSDQKTYQTYTKTHPKTGEVYTGRTSGKGTPEENIRARDRSHHLRNESYDPAVLDKSSKSKDAIRGREQQLIDHNGGAKSQNGTSGNKINGISPSNKNAKLYKRAAEKEFGKLKKK